MSDFPTESTADIVIYTPAANAFFLVWNPDLKVVVDGCF